MLIVRLGGQVLASKLEALERTKADVRRLEGEVSAQKGGGVEAKH